MHRSILRIALPSILTNITVPLLGAVDTAITGHLGSAAFIGAIAVGASLFSSIYWLCNFLRMSSVGLTAQAYGQANPRRIAVQFWRPLRIAAALALLMMLLQDVVARLYFHYYRATPDIALLSRRYFDLLIWGAFPSLALFVINGWLLGLQNAKAPLLIAVVQNAVNVALSYTLAIGLGWQLDGVAIGTLAAQWLGFALGMALVVRTLRRRGYACSWREIWGNAQSWWAFFSVNSTIFLRTLCLVCVMLSIPFFGAQQGVNALAANSLLLQFFLLLSFVLDGLANAGEAIGGQLWGQYDASGLRRLVRQLFLWGLIAALAFTLVYLLGGPFLLWLLTDQIAVRQFASQFIAYVVLMPLVGFAAFLLDGLYIGFTATRPMLFGVAGATALYFAAHVALAPLLGNHALWIAFLLYLATRGAIQALWLGPTLRNRPAPQR